MKTLEQVVNEKLEMLTIPDLKPPLAQLMTAVVEDVQWETYDQATLEGELADLMMLTDDQALIYLGVSEKELVILLEPLTTAEQIAELLLNDLMWEALKMNLDYFPYRRGML